MLVLESQLKRSPEFRVTLYKFKENREKTNAQGPAPRMHVIFKKSLKNPLNDFKENSSCLSLSSGPQRSVPCNKIIIVAKRWFSHDCKVDIFFSTGPQNAGSVFCE